MNSTNHLKGIFNAWSPQNPDSSIPVLFTRNTNGEKRISTYLLKDGSYLKLRTAELEYTFPESMVKKAMISHLRAYVSANSAFTIKKRWDSNRFSGPDLRIRDFGYVIPFIATVGVNITF